jgi:DNA mismatch repair protein MutS
MRVTVSEFNNQMSFLRKIEYGSTNKSFGVEVAKLAGLPPQVIERAKMMLKSQLKEDDEVVTKLVEKYDYMDELEKKKYKDIEKTLSNVDINNLTPLEAMTILAELKSKIK